MEVGQAGKEFVVCAQVHYEAALLGGFVYRKGGGGGLQCDTEHESTSRELGGKEPQVTESCSLEESRRKSFEWARC